VTLWCRVLFVAASLAAPAAQSAAPRAPVDVEAGKRALAARSLQFPVKGYENALRDNFDERRGDVAHEALDIMAPRGTPVIAVDDGTIAKLFKSVPGGLTIYQFDPSDRLAYYYAHLDRYAPDLKQGDKVKRGQVIGYVGSTGNAKADAPHLHFTVYALGPAKEWWKGVAINPYRQLATPPGAQSGN
jgi:murein DD-endopeptidase MepM/ murein hydrolase activator NlpD